MRTFLTITFTLILMASYAQKNMYEQSMLSALEKLNQAETTRDYTDAANIFERIAQTETSEWLPLYHAAHAYLIMGFTEQDLPAKDAYFDKAQEFLERAFRIAPEESELFSLQAFIYPGKITVDPIGRGSELLGKMNEAIDKAIRLNPDNPRSYYLKAITLLHMPEAFGGGKSAAKPIFEAAQQKFDQYKPKSPIWPNWGKEMNEEELSKL
jgi:tetratricopeptide (TPR) repeat protein